MKYLILPLLLLFSIGCFGEDLKKTFSNQTRELALQSCINGYLTAVNDALKKGYPVVTDGDGGSRAANTHCTSLVNRLNL